MFKKPFTLGNSHKLSGGDRKKVRRDCQKQFACTDEQIDLLLPLKGGELEICKCTALTKMQLYLHDKVPILVDTTGKNDLLPTTFALWRVPALLPVIHVKHPAVSQYIIGGADLMIPGVLLPAAGLPALRQWQMVAVAVPGNPAPVAIGRAALASDKILERIEHGAKGRAVEVVQSYKDKLWEGAVAAGADATPNSGFFSDVVLPPDWQPGDEDKEEMEAATDTADVPLATPGESSSASADVPAAETPSAPPRPEVSAAEMDDLMQTCLLQALHKRVKDAELPMAASTLWAQHVLPSRPPGVHVDPKLSTYKKVAKFFQAQAKLGLIRISEDKHSKETVVQGINRNCDAYEYFRPFKQPAAEPVASPPPPTAAAAAAALGSLSIEERFRVGRELQPLFAAVSMDPEALYTPAEASQCALEYIKQQKLEQGPSRTTRIKLDQVLADALFKGLLKKGEMCPTEMHKSDVRAALMRRMHPLHLLKRGDLEVVKKGNLAPLNIAVAKRQGNKKVTIVHGMETYLLDAVACSKELQKVFACATTVTPMEGSQKKGQFEVCIQGNVAEKAATYFEKTCGIPKRNMTVKTMK